MNRMDPNYHTVFNSDEKTRQWLLTVRRHVYPREHLVLDPARCALLVIDMLHYFADPQGRAFIPASEAIVPNIQRLVTYFHQHHSPIFFTRHCHDGDHDLGMLGKFWSDYIRCGRQESKIIPAFEVDEKRDVIIRKRTYDAFYETGLMDALRKQGRDQVLITGVLTNMCCETSARSAFVRGLEVYFCADGTASTAEIFHLNSLISIASAVANIVSSREVVEGNES